MNIGIEASRANRPQKTGVEWYALQVIQQLKSIAGERHEWLLYTNDELLGDLAKMPLHWQQSRLFWMPKYLWTQIRLSWEMWRRPCDVLFVPAHVLPMIAPKKNVVTIHDVGFRRHPELYPLKQRLYHEWTTRDIVRRCPRILTVSDFSKREIVELYGANPERITVAPLAVADSLLPGGEQEMHDVREHLHLPQHFILYIGRVEYKKNVQVLVEALNEYRRQTNDQALKLVLAGRPGYGFDALKKRIKDLGLRDEVHFIGYLNEKDKGALLSASDCYVQPSWYEGFGIPVLEAMRCGTPVIAANTSALPEVAGEGNALFFDPRSPQDLAAKIIEARDPAKRRALIQNGKVREAQFSWRKTAEIILPLLANW